MPHQITALKQSTTVIDGIVNGSISPGLELFLGRSDSLKYATAVAIAQQRPAAQFGSLKIAAMNTLFGIDGQAISATPLDFYTVVRTTGGSFLTTGEKISVNKGIIVPRTLSVRQGTPAVITYAVIMGGTAADAAPFSTLSAQTAPVGMTVDEAFFLGAVTKGSGDLLEIVGWDIDFGFQIDVQMCDGWQFPACVAWSVQQPTIRILSQESTALVAVTVDGDDDTVTLKLLKFLEGGFRAGTGDLTFSTHENIMHVESLGGNSGDDAETAIVVVPVFDGTNAPITVA